MNFSLLGGSDIKLFLNWEFDKHPKGWGLLLNFLFSALLGYILHPGGVGVQDHPFLPLLRVGVDFAIAEDRCWSPFFPGLSPLY